MPFDTALQLMSLGLSPTAENDRTTHLSTQNPEAKSFNWWVYLTPKHFPGGNAHRVSEQGSILHLQ